VLHDFLFHRIQPYRHASAYRTSSQESVQS
jgi:hypothetical protein